MKFKDFKFSIIITIDGSQSHLMEAIDSVINQSIGFENNVQLILVGNGCDINSRGICFDCQEKYPDNVLVFSQKQYDVAKARNMALKYVSGEYVNFLNCNDYLSQNTLLDVFNFFKLHFQETDVVAIPIADFNSKMEMGESRVIDLEREPFTKFLFSSVFIKSDVFDLKLREDLISSQDIFLLNQVLLLKKTIGMVNSSNYHLGKKDNGGLNEAIFKKDYFFDRLEEIHFNLIDFCNSKFGKLPNFIQYSMLLDIKEIVEFEDLFMCDNKNDEELLFNNLKSILSNICDEIISESDFRDSLKHFLFKIKYDEVYFGYDDNHILLKHDERILCEFTNPEVSIKNIDFGQDQLMISGLLYDYLGNDELTLTAIRKVETGDFKLFSAEIVEDALLKNVVYLEEIQNYRHFTLKVPLDSESSQISFKVIHYVDENKTNLRDDNLIIYTPSIDFSEELYEFTKNQYKITLNDEVLDVKSIFKFKFSIVMAVYNTRDYLHEAIDSIINQTIGFKDNVQLILVDDGSKDDSLSILNDYQRRYPQNIVVLSQENAGQATARNNGLNHVDAKYVNFLDSDDYLDEITLEKVWDFFETNQDKTDIVAIPIQYFGRRDSPHILNDKFNTPRVIDLEKEPNNPQLSSSSAFFKSDVLKSHQFPTDVIFSEDVILINEILVDNKFLGVLDGPMYYYRRRYDESSTIDTVRRKKEFFTEKFKNYFLYLFEYAKLKDGYVPNFLQYTLAYDLQWIFFENLSILNNQETEEFWIYLRKVVSHIDDEVILNHDYIRNESVKFFFLSLKKGGLHTEIKGNNVLVKTGEYRLANLATHNFWLDIVDLREGVLNISGFLNTIIDRKFLSFEAVKYINGTSESYVGKTVKYTSRPDLVLLNEPFQFTNNFDIFIPIEKNEQSSIRLRLNYHKDGDNTNFSTDNVVSMYCNIHFTVHVKLKELSNYKATDFNILYFEDDIFYLMPSSLRNILKKEKENMALIEESFKDVNNFQVHETYEEIMHLRKIYRWTLPFFKIYKKFRQIYLFQDRIDVADDNAYHLYNYARKKHDGVKKYFVLSKESKLYDKIGNVLEHGSFKHKLLMLHADKIISSHPYETVINPFWSYENDQRKLIAGLLNYNIYFIQHGVTVGNISSWLYKYDKNLTLIASAAKKEAESFLEEGYGYDESIIHLLGFPRFDNLNNVDKKQILFIPTWRKNLRGNRNAFLNSIYLKNINSFFNSPKLQKFIDEGYKVIFKPHQELINAINDESDERYIDLFDIPDYVYISYDDSYQDLFNTSSMLITDYSSVFFDFAYLKKPLIYYRPVEDYHYDAGYFDYEIMGFGDIITSEEDLFEKIEVLVENNCEMEEKYKQRVDDFFEFNDRNNCKRVYDWIFKH